MIVLSQALVLSPPEDIELNTPVFGLDTLLTTSTVAATTQADGSPASNLANPSTALRWTAGDAEEQLITAAITSLDDIDYLAIAVHNLGTLQSVVSVEGNNGGSPDWFELVEERILPNDDPALFRFEPQVLMGIRLRITPTSSPAETAPFIAVMHVGKLLVMPRGTHQDHTPINLNIQSNVMTGKSEAGNFLGRIVLSEQRSTTIAFNRLNNAWYREYMQPFIAASKADPFFFAWKPQEFINDVGYCWMTNDPQPSHHFDTGTMAITLNMGGVAI